MNRKYLIVLLGPTGIGKTDLSIKIAKNFNTCILSCDSRQFYQELKIGTAIPTVKQLDEVKHYFIGHISIHDYYNAFNFETEALTKLDEIYTSSSNIALLTGGAGMYIDAVCKGIDDMPTIQPHIRNQLKEEYKEKGLDFICHKLKERDREYFNIVDLKNAKRILHALEICLQTGKTFTSFRKNKPRKRNFTPILIGLKRDRSELYKRIELRVDAMMKNGLIEEAQQLYPDRGKNALNTVGYKELFEYLSGKITMVEAIELIKRNTRRYAKRQITWFNRNKKIHWFDPNKIKDIFEFVNSKIE